ncbi:C80 family cysteine peptidase [Mitsuaria sp. CC2]|uniref:C80 family cysteine peptidase n=1 Tax=Mitsuaria sp. CC2 TaxID=3029186 RepID=UPI003B8BC2B3
MSFPSPDTDVPQPGRRDPRVPPHRSSAGAGRATAIAATLDELTSGWPDDESLPRPLAAELFRSLDTLSLSTVDAALPVEDLRQVRRSLLEAILNEAPLEMAKVHAALFDAERWNRDEAGASPRATRAFQGLLDGIVGLLDQAGPEVAAGSRQGLTLARFFAEALASTGPDRPFTVRLDDIFLAGDAGTDRATRLRGGLHLAALLRLRVLHAAGVIGGLRIAAAAIPMEAQSAPWTALPDGSHALSLDAASSVLAERYFDPKGQRVAKLRDRIFMPNLRNWWEHFVAEANAVAFPDGSQLQRLVGRMNDFAGSILNRIAGLDKRPLPERAAVMSTQAWDTLRSEAERLVAEVRAGAGGNRRVQRLARRLEKLTTHFLDFATRSWLRRSALGMNALAPVTASAPLRMLASLAPGVSQQLDRSSGIVRLDTGGGTLTWRVAPLLDATDPSAWVRQDMALRELDALITHRYWDGPLVMSDAWPRQVSYIDGALIVDGGPVERLATLDAATAATAGPALGLAAAPQTTLPAKAVAMTVPADGTGSTGKDGTLPATRWSPDPTGALTVEQRLSTIAAAFETVTARWKLAPADIDAMRASLLPGLIDAVAARWPAWAVRPDGVHRTVAAHVLEALLTGSALRLRKAVLSLLHAPIPSGEPAASGLPAALSDLASLKQLAWVGVAKANPAYAAATSQAVLDLFMATIAAMPDRLLHLDYDAVHFTHGVNRTRSKDAAAGVTFALHEVLQRLGDAGLTGSILWHSASPHATGAWEPASSGFVSTGDMTPLKVKWRFDPTVGLLPLEESRPLTPLPIDDARPLRALAALAPELQQILDRPAGTLRLAWKSGEVRSRAVMQLKGVTIADAAKMDTWLRRLDLLLTAHVARADVPDLNALPIRMTLSADSLSDGPRVIARRESSRWAFGGINGAANADDAAWPPSADRAGHAGRVEVITAFLREATADWPRPATTDDVWRTTLVDGFGARPFESGSGGGGRSSRMRAVAETFLDGVLDVSVPTLHRAYALMLDVAKPGTDPAVNYRETAEIMRQLLDNARAFLGEQRGADALRRSVAGRAVADLYISLLASSADGAPLVLDVEPLRDALERSWLNDPMSNRRAGLMLSLRDQLRLMSRTGVIGPIVYDAARPPFDDTSEGWTPKNQRWQTDRDLMAERWPKAVADADSGSVKSLSVRKDLLAPWENLVGELDSAWYDTVEDTAAMRLITVEAESISEALYDLQRKPAADRTDGMSAAAWDQRVAKVEALRNQIVQSPVTDSIHAYAEQLVRVARTAAEQAGTPRFQAAFGRGTLAAIDETTPLPLFRRIAPDVSQRLDRAAGVVHLGDGSTTRAWQLRAPAQNEVAQRWQLDMALRELDILAVRRFAQRDPVDIGALPDSLTYEAGALTSDTGELLARRPDLPPVSTADTTRPLDDATSTNTGAKDSTSNDVPPAKRAGMSRRPPPFATSGGSRNVDAASPARPPHAMDVLIAAWLDKQLELSPLTLHGTVNLRRHRKAAVEAAARLGFPEHDLLLALTERSEHSDSFQDIISLDWRLRQLAPGRSWTTGDTVALLESIYGPGGDTGDLTSAQAIRARFLSDILDSRATGKPVVIDFDRLKAWHDRGGTHVAAATRDIAHGTPVLMALAQRGVLGELRVVSRAGESGRRGDWRPDGDHHVSTTPLSDLLGLPPSPALHLYDAYDALPGLTGITTLFIPGERRRPSHATLSAQHERVPTVIMMLKRGGVERWFSYKLRDANELSGSALDLDVAIAHVIGDGSTARRLPVSLRWESDGLLGLYPRAQAKDNPPRIATLFKRLTNGELDPEDAVIERYRRFTDDVGPAPELLDRPLADWGNELTAAGRKSSSLVDLQRRTMATDAQPPTKRERLPLKLIVLQMEDSPQAFEASLRHAGDERTRGQVLWLQADRHGASKVLHGADLPPTTPGQKVKLVIVGQGSTLLGASRALSGYDGTALARRVNQVLNAHFPMHRPTADKVTMLGCDLASEFQPQSFVDHFRKHFQNSERYAVTAFRGQVLFPADGEDQDRFSQRWILADGADQATHHAPGTVFVTKHAPRYLLNLTPDDKYPDATPTLLSPEDTDKARPTALDTPGEAPRWTPTTALDQRQRLHAIIDLAFFLPGYGTTPELLESAATLALDVLKHTFKVDDTRQDLLQPLRTIADDFGAGLFDAHRLKQALDGLHRLGPPGGAAAQVALDHAPVLDTATLMAAAAGRPSTGSSPVAAADAVFMLVLDRLDAALAQTMLQSAVADITPEHGAAAAHLRLTALAVRAGLTGQPITVEVGPRPASSTVPDLPPALLQGWHGHLALAEPTLRRMAMLGLMPALVVMRRSGPGATPQAWTPAGDGGFKSGSAWFGDELPVLTVIHQSGDRAWWDTAAVRRWYSELRAAWADLKSQLSRFESVHGRTLPTDERQALQLLFKELDDKIAAADLVAATQEHGEVLARRANQSLDVMRSLQPTYEIDRAALRREIWTEPSGDTWSVTSMPQRILAAQDSLPFLRFHSLSSPVVRVPLDPANPMPALRAALPDLQQRLDRASGTVSFDAAHRPAFAQMQVRGLPASTGSSLSVLEAIGRQDVDVMALEWFALQCLPPADARTTTSFPAGWRLELIDDTVRAGGLLLAKRTAIPDATRPAVGVGPWRMEADNLASVRRLWHPAPPPSSVAPGWGTHGLGLTLSHDPATPTAAPARLRLIFQIEDSPEAFTAAWLDWRKHEDAAVWIQLDVDGGSAVKWGAARLDAADAGTVLKLAIVGRSGQAGPQGRQVVAGWAPGLLATQLHAWLRSAGLVPHDTAADASRRPVEGITLIACDTATPALENNFALRFLRELQVYGWTDGVALTARTGELHVTGSEDGDTGPGTTRKLTKHLADDGTPRLAHQQPGDTVVMRFDRRSNQVGVVDRYPASIADTPSTSPGARHEMPDAKPRYDVAMDRGGQADTPMGSILATLSPQGRAFFDGIDIDAIGPLPLASDAMPGTVLERVLDGIARSAAPGLDDPWRLSTISEDNALAHLRGEGVVAIDAQGGIRLNADRLTQLVGGDQDPALMRVAAGLLKVPDAIFERVAAASTASRSRRFIDKVRGVRATLRASLRDVDWADQGNKGLGAINTVIGAVQLVQGWRAMDPTMKGLSIVQTGSIVITPLTAKLGAWLSTVGPVARSRVLGLISRSLAAGVFDVPLSVLGLVVIGLQWEEFRKSGLGTDSHAYRSLVANTAMITTFTTLGLVSTGVTVAAAFSASAALATAASAAGPVGLIITAAAMTITGAVNAGLWLDEYGDFLRSTTPGESFVSGLAMSFGFRTSMLLRAETSKVAAETAAAREGALRQQWEDLMTFRADSLAKVGIATVHYPDRKVVVKHATFKVPDQDPPYAFVLQDLPPYGVGTKTLQRDAILNGRPPGVAWLGLEIIGSQTPLDEQATADQWIELFGSASGAVGGRGRDRFMLDSGSSGGIVGFGELDDVLLQAQQADVTLRPMTHDHAPQWTYRLSVKPSGTAVERVTTMAEIERLMIRQGGSADLQGGPDDDHFDVEATTARIAGGGGRNTYVLRSGNTIATSSGDLAIWSPGVSAVITYSPGLPADTVIQAGMLHETLSFSRNDDTLRVRHGQDTLTLTDFFARPDETARDRHLLIVDALGTRMVLTDPRGLGLRPHGSGEVAKVLFLDADTPASRRWLGSDDAPTRHHLPAGGGHFHASQRTAIAPDIMLDVAVERLRYRRVGRALVITEVAPADAGAGYTPLTLTLTDDLSPGTTLLWARAGAGTDSVAPLILPAPDAPEEGAMRVRGAPATAGGHAPMADHRGPAQPSATLDSTVKKGSAKDDVLDAADLPGVLVMSGGEGSDTYRVPAGRSIVIDNAAADGVRDFLELDADPAQLRFRREGDDLIVDTGNGTITLRDHAVDPTARHLSLALTGSAQQGQQGRYALPVIHDSRFMMYGHDPVEGAVPGFVPGRHIVQAPPEAAWTPRSAFLDAAITRTVSLGPDASFDRHGASLLLSSGSGDASSMVYVRDYDRTFRHFEIATPSWLTAPYEEFPSGDWQYPLLPDGLRDTWRRYQELGAPAPLLALLQHQDIHDAALVKKIAAVHRAFTRRAFSDASACDPVAVRTYLRLMDLSAEVADKVQSTLPAQLFRMRRLLEVSSAAGLALPAAFLDAYAASDVDTALSPQRHGRLLMHLAAEGVPWSHAERVLAHDLPLEVVEPFEAWARTQPGEALDSTGSVGDLDEFVRLLVARPDDTLVPTSQTAALLGLVLRIKGRPADVATALAAAMVASGTLDEAWMDGMHRAGIFDHEVLARLRRAKVSAEDVILGNAHRQAYEQGHRSSLIEVGLSRLLRPSDSTVVSNVLNKYLALDDSGNSFTTQDAERVPGRRYDLVPGEVLDQFGQSPDAEDARLDWELARIDLEEEYKEKHADSYWKLKIHRTMSERDRTALQNSLDRGKASYVTGKSPQLSAIAHLHGDGVIETKKVTLPGAAGFGRSTPDNLVDGVATGGEATAWRPHVDMTTDDKGAPTGYKPVNLDRNGELAWIEFAFAHALALTAVTLDVAPQVLVKARPDDSTGRWRIQAREAGEGGGTGGRWIDVSGPFTLANGPYRVVAPVDTGGVPYRAYRLAAVGGHFPIDAWLTEVTFTTAEAGLSPMTTRLMAGGYSREDSDMLMARGLITDVAVARAVELRERLGALAPGLVADEVLTQPPWSEETWRDLARLKPFVPAKVLLREARQGWSTASQAHLLAEGWPRPTSEVAIDRDRMAPVLRDALSSWRLSQGADLADLPTAHEAAVVEAVLDAATGDIRALPRVLQLPGWQGRTLGGQRTASRSIDLGAPLLKELLAPPWNGKPMPTASVDAPFLLAADAFVHLAKALHRRLVLDADERQAVQASAPMLLQLLTVTARISGLILPLRRPTGRDPGDEALRTAVNDIRSRLHFLSTATALKSEAIMDMDLPGSVEQAAVNATAGPLRKALTLLQRLDHDKWNFARFSMDALARHRLDVKQRLMAAVFQGADLPLLPRLDRLTDLILQSVACEPGALPQALTLAAGLLHKFSVRDPARAGQDAVLLVADTMTTVIDAWRKDRNEIFRRYDERVGFAPRTLADLLVSTTSDVPYEFRLPEPTREPSSANDLLVMRSRISGDIQVLRDAGVLKVTVLSDARPTHGVLDWRQQDARGPWTTQHSLRAVFREPGLYMLGLGMRPDEIMSVFATGIRSAEEIDRMRTFQSAVIRDVPLSGAWAMSDPRPSLDPITIQWIRRLHGLGARARDIFDIVEAGVSDTERALVLVDHLPYDTWGRGGLVASDLAPLRADIERSVNPWMSPDAASSFSALLIRAICGERSALRQAIRLVPEPSVLIEAAAGLYDKVLARSMDRLGEERAAEAATPFALTLQTLAHVQRADTLYLPADVPDSPQEIGQARILRKAAAALQRLVDVGLLRAHGIHEAPPENAWRLLSFQDHHGKRLWQSEQRLTDVLKEPPAPGTGAQASLLAQAMSAIVPDGALPGDAGHAPRREEASSMLAPQAA